MNKLKVGTRLALGFACVCALLVITIAVGIYNVGLVNEGTDTIVYNKLPKMDMSHSLLEQTDVIAIALRNMMLSKNEADRSRQREVIDGARRKSDAIFEKLTAMKTSAEGEKSTRDMLAGSVKYREGQDKLLALIKGGDDAAAQAYLNDELRPVFGAYKAVLVAKVERQNDQIAETALAGLETYKHARTVMLGLGVLALVLATAIGVVITRGLLRQLGGEPDYAAAVAGEIARGNLGVHVAVGPTDTSSLIFAMEAMRAQLSGVVREVRSGTDLITTASAEIAAGNQELSVRTEQQAASLEETASSIEELTSTVRQNADNARQANVLAESASGVAAKGGEVVAQVVDTMQNINASAKNIVDIIGVINGIAFQTNILALNAAVEAARAGEQGRGFAVVAAEVRVLAQRSAEAAKEIKSLIDDSVQQTDTGTQLVNEAGVTMRAIIDSVRSVTDIMGEISAASAEQSAGIEQINMAVVQMDQVTQQNAALVEEAAAAAASMQDQAQTLADAVGVFTLDEAAPAIARPVRAAIAHVPAQRRLASNSDWNAAA
jgi:methyl-accepting chemotaxis protein